MYASIIHPTSIVGPNDFKPGLPMQEMVNLANGKRKLFPNWGYNFVDTRDGITRGQTIVDYFNAEKGKQNVRVVTKSDNEGFLNLLTSLVK